jgi:predicted Zn-dependent protease
MAPLEVPDAHYLNAAEGWLGLGNPGEARRELDQIRPNHQLHPAVLDMRWQICAKEGNWAEALATARTLIRSEPELSSGWVHQAYALRRVPEGGIKSAWQALLPAFERFPKEPIIAYNLSCYACQLGQLEAARVWFRKALAIGGKMPIKELALEEPDLQPLWEEIKKL